MISHYLYIVIIERFINGKKYYFEMKNEEPSLENLLQDAIVEVTDVSDSSRRERLIGLIKGIKEHLTTPELMANYLRDSPVTTPSLQILARKSPHEYSAKVPQITDSQTGLFSKVYFEKVLLPSAIETANQNSVPLAYFSIDLDDFKKINTEYGERNGDKVIELFSDLLKKSFRSTSGRKKELSSVETEKRTSNRRKNADSLDYIALSPDKYTQGGRVGGGEEFGVILYGISETEALNLSTTRLLDKVRQTDVPYDDGKIRFTFSGGIAQFEKGMTAEQLMVNAMAARAYSKKNGKNQITSYSQIPK